MGYLKNALSRRVFSFVRGSLLFAFAFIGGVPVSWADPLHSLVTVTSASASSTNGGGSPYVERIWDTSQTSYSFELGSGASFGGGGGAIGYATAEMSRPGIFQMQAKAEAIKLSSDSDSGSAYSNNMAFWTDTFTIAGIPSGTPVSIRTSMGFFGSSKISDLPYDGVSISELSYRLGAPCLGNNFAFSGNVSVSVENSCVFQMLAGDQFVIEQQLWTAAWATGYFPLDVLRFSESSIKTWLYFDVLTPGASLVSDSGFSYASPVPEPATGLLLGSAIVALLGLHKRKKR